MKILKNGGVTAPKGFKANGVVAGIKRSGKRDLALIVSDCPAVSRGVYKIPSRAPLLVSQKHLPAIRRKRSSPIAGMLTVLPARPE